MAGRLLGLGERDDQFGEVRGWDIDELIVLFAILTASVGETTNIGDLGVLLFAVLGDPTPARVAVFVFGVACAVPILLGFLVAVGSLSFFVGRNEGGDLGFHALLLFSSYPVDVFGGAVKVFLYTVVPAGFVTSIPAELVVDGRLTLGHQSVEVCSEPRREARWTTIHAPTTPPVVEMTRSPIVSP